MLHLLDRPSLRLEVLESRLVPTTALFDPGNGSLAVYGSNDADTIRLVQVNGRIALDSLCSPSTLDLSKNIGYFQDPARAKVSISIKVPGSDADGTVAAADVKCIYVAAYDGDDTVFMDGVCKDIPVYLRGGYGADYIQGGDGNEFLDGSSGND